MGYNRFFALLAFLGLAVFGTFIYSFTPWFGYAAHNVQDDEIAVVFHRNEPVEVVGPGIYTKMARFYDIRDVNVSGMQFCAEDLEVLTKDNQIIGVLVCGDVFRPSIANGDVYLSRWADYRVLYTSDSAIIGSYEYIDGVDTLTGQGVMQQISLQVIKECVGDRDFLEAAVGSSRGDLSDCVSEGLTESTATYGLRIENVRVPQVYVEDEVRDSLKAITKTTQEVEEAKQEAKLAEARADRDLAIRQGEIRVEEGIKQEKLEQDVQTAELSKLAIEAELKVIEAQASNDLREAELQLEVVQAELAVAQESAKVDVAKEAALAEVFTNNPAYVSFLAQEAWASSLSDTTMILPAGTNPATVLSDAGASVVISGDQ